MALLPVDEAIQRIGKKITPLKAQDIPLQEAAGRVLASPLMARGTHPPFDSSAMDGYALQAADLTSLPVHLKMAGEAAAGGGYDARVQPGEAVRILTGAPVPEGADTVIIQENTQREGGTVTVLEGSPAGRHIRPAGTDFTQGSEVLAAGSVLGPAQLALAAAANHPEVPVYRKPKVAFFATGNELIPPGQRPSGSQIIASNGYGLAALVQALGGIPVDLGIARDTAQDISEKAEATLGADLVVTTGGASVGDHDLVQQVMEPLGLEIDFWKIAMRPGKPLMFGTFRNIPFIGLPGNPVSALVCASLFVRVALETLTGRPARHPDTVFFPVDHDLPANGDRQDYLRARRVPGTGGTSAGSRQYVQTFPRQDSSVLSTLALSDALVIRPPGAPPAIRGDNVPALLTPY